MPLLSELWIPTCETNVSGNAHITHFSLIPRQGQISVLKKTFKTAKPQITASPSLQTFTTARRWQPFSTIITASALSLLMGYFAHHSRSTPSRAQHTILIKSNQLPLRFISFMSLKPHYFCAVCVQPEYVYKNSTYSFARWLSETQSWPTSHKGNLGPDLQMWYELR